MRDVNMNNQMKHVLVLDTINSSSPEWKTHGSEKKVGITFMSHKQVLVEGIQGLHMKQINQNHINSFDDAHT